MSDEVRITVSERAGRMHASSGASWEPRMGYCRGVRTGSTITVSGTVGALADGSYPPTLVEQTRRALQIVRAAVEALGGRIDHVTRTRIFVTDIARWQEVAEVHGEVFRDIRPATSMVQVDKLIDAATLIEADAIVT
jgi:enamine deaminase RidA (YjgF/YER057c/UK114 family)